MNTIEMRRERRRFKRFLTEEKLIEERLDKQVDAWIADEAKALTANNKADCEYAVDAALVRIIDRYIATGGHVNEVVCDNINDELEQALLREGAK